MIAPHITTHSFLVSFHGPLPLGATEVIPNRALPLLIDYRETAAKFQKEWHVKEPHQHFGFAPHVKSHALVSIINKGLLYQALERQRDNNKVITSSIVASRDHLSPASPPHRSDLLFACLFFSPSAPTSWAKYPYQSHQFIFLAHLPSPLCICCAIEIHLTLNN